LLGDPETNRVFLRVERIVAALIFRTNANITDVPHDCLLEVELIL